METKQRKIGWRVSRVLLLAVLCINLLTVLFTATDLRARLKWLPYAAVAVESGSMEPEISAGDILIVREVPFDTLQIGNDVTFRGVDELITHRIVGKNGNFFITQGLANNTTDSALLGPEEYCAKVVAVLPAVGWLLTILTSPLPLLLASLLILSLFFLPPLAGKLFDRISPKTDMEAKKNFSPGKRLLLCAAAVSVLAVTPCMTGAKYTAEVNRYETVVSSAVHFSSNYLSESGNRYNVQGWRGNAYDLTLSIKNYDNDLLVNPEGSDLVYGLAVEKIEGAYEGQTYSGDYTVTIEPMENTGVTEAADSVKFGYPASWGAYETMGPYVIIGGDTKLENRFQISISPTGELAPDTMIRFRVLACTSEQDQYFIEMTGDFSFKVAETTEFLGEKTMDDRGTLVRYSVRTSLISEGSSTKLVKFQWNPDELYINEFESSAYNVIVNWPSEYYDKTNGTLYMRLQAYSSVNLQFFKVDPTFKPGDGSITAEVVEEIG